MVTTTPAKCFLSLAIAVGCVATTLSAQIEITQDDGSYIEMTPEEFTSLVGKMQRLRAERIRQVNTVRQQRAMQTAQAQPPQQFYSALPQPQASPNVYVTSPNVQAERLQALERQTAMLAEEIRLLREQLANAAPVPAQTYAAPQPAVAAAPQPASDPDQRRLNQLDRERQRDRDRYNDELRREQDRIRDLQRQIADLDRRDRDRGRDYRVGVPAVVPVPAAPARADTVRIGSDIDAELLRQQDSLNRALMALREEMSRRPQRDTVVVERAPTIIRDTVRSTSVVTRTLVEDRIDLAAVLFANNSTALNAQAELQIREAVEAYRREPDASILLRGFASKTGNFEYNQTLSTRRATAVRDRLNALGVPPSQIRVIGNGIDPGTNLAEARRVEIQLLRKPRD